MGSPRESKEKKSSALPDIAFDDSSLRQSIAQKELAKYAEMIWQKGSANEYKMEGLGTPIYKGKNWVPVPSHLAEAYRMATSPTNDHFTALVNFIALTKFEAEEKQKHEGRSKETHSIYTDFARITGRDIFPRNAADAIQFDEAISSRVEEVRRFRSEPAVVEFEHNKAIENKNIERVKSQLTILLATIPAERETEAKAAKNLLSQTMDRILTAYTKKDIELYINDYIYILKDLFPDREDAAKLASLITSVQDFGRHHLKMITDLNSRFKDLYADILIQAIAIAAQPIGGELLPALPEELVSASLSTLSTKRIASATAAAAGYKQKDHEKLVAPPIVPVTRSETKSEKVLRVKKVLKSDAIKAKATLYTATLVLSLAGGPVGVAIAGSMGVIAGVYMGGKKIHKTHSNLSKLKAFTKKQKQIHEKQFCSYVINHGNAPTDRLIRKRISEYRQGESKTAMELTSTAGLMRSFEANPTSLSPKSPKEKTSPSSSPKIEQKISFEDERYLNPPSQEKEDTGMELQELPDVRKRGVASK